MAGPLEAFRNRIEALKKKIKQFTPEIEESVREEFKNLFIDLARSSKELTRIQDELRAVAHDFKRRTSSQADMERFFSFMKSQTSVELNTATLLDRAWNLIVIEDHDEAMKVLKKVLDSDARNTKALGFMALAFMGKELYDDAMLYLQRVLLVEPDNPFARNNLGYICYKKGIWGEAIEHLIKAAKQKQDRTAALYANFYLGVLYYERSMITDALKFLEEAISLGPNLQDAYYYLGCAETKRYEFKKAVEYFERCIKIRAQSKYGKLCKEEIAKIKPLTDAGKMFESEES